MSTYRPNDTKNKVKNDDNTHIVNGKKNNQSVMQTIVGLATVDAMVETP